MKKLTTILFLLFLASSANAASVFYSTGDGSLDINAPGDTDQALAFFNTGENVSAISPVPFNLGITGDNVIGTATMNRFSGFDSDFLLEVFSTGGGPALFSLTKADFTNSGGLGTFSTALPFLAIDNYNLVLSGTILENNTSLTLRVEAVPLPAAVWFMVSGLIGLLGFTRRKQS